MHCCTRSGRSAIRLTAIDLTRPRIAAKVSPAPIAIKTWLRSIATVMSAKNLYEFPRADHTHPTLGCLDLDEDCADVRDRADTSPHSYLVTDVKFHLHNSGVSKTIAIMGTCACRKVTAIAVRNRVEGWPTRRADATTVGLFRSASRLCT